MIRAFVAALIFAAAVQAQRGAGELRLSVKDAADLPLEAVATLYGPAVHVRLTIRTGADGSATVRNLPAGSYHLQVTREGFSPAAQTVQITGPAPLDVAVALALAPVSSAITVEDAEPLLDPYRTGATYFIGKSELRDRRTASPGRAVLSLVDQQPGWLLEANGVLHPRGAEYGVQYVIDGIPATDNRSPSFAPEFDIEDVEQMNVLTSGYPAEFGRKLGGVVEVVTSPDRRGGTHGKVSGFGGSFDTAGGYASMQQGWKASSLRFSGNAAATSRYLDPPVEENFTNRGTTGGFSAAYERDLGRNDRMQVQLEHTEARFQVPNERIQQDNGQRQDRTASETVGRAGYTRVLSPAAVFQAHGMGRDVSAALWSNPFSWPIEAAQDRGFREGYGNASFSVQSGAHALKAGVEASFTELTERFGFDITAPETFDGAVPGQFRFNGRARGRDYAGYVQDLVRAGAWTLSAGLRWDRYQLLVDEHAWSPRLGIAWHSDQLGLVLRASYDRTFQTPAFENILVSSSPEARTLGDVAFLPVRPSRGNFFEVGFVKSAAGRARLEARYFVRSIRNFADDSLLLNTGVTFPIAFESGDVRGTELKLDLPRWGPASGYVSYSNMTGTARLPGAGGLFLGDDAVALLQSHERIAITQDQRNTARAWLRGQLAPRLWTAVGASYGSGLPVETEGFDPATAAQQYSQRILSRVNLSRGRVRPSFSLDLSAGADLLQRERVVLRVQADVLNLTNRLNLINFAGVFSGTALAPPRTASVRMAFEF